MGIKTSHYDKEDDCTSRFYLKDKLLLEINNSLEDYRLDELIVIDGITYTIDKIINYPKDLIKDYFLKVK